MEVDLDLVPVDFPLGFGKSRSFPDTYGFFFFFLVYSTFEKDLGQDRSSEKVLSLGHVLIVILVVTPSG